MLKVSYFALFNHVLKTCYKNLVTCLCNFDLQILYDPDLSLKHVLCHSQHRDNFSWTFYLEPFILNLLSWIFFLPPWLFQHDKTLCFTIKLTVNLIEFFVLCCRFVVQIFLHLDSSLLILLCLLSSTSLSLSFSASSSESLFYSHFSTALLL